MSAVVRSKWTAADEARLVELQEQKKRIMQQNRAPVDWLVQMFFRDNEPDADSLTEFLITHADSIRDALEPFDSGTRAT